MGQLWWEDLNYWTPFDAAMAVAVRFTRRYPDLWRWQSCPDGDAAHEDAVRAFLADPVIRQMLDYEVKLRRKDGFMDGLMYGAARYIERLDGQLAAAWQRVTSGPAWPSLPQSARDLYDALHAVAAEPGPLGGPKVLMSHGLAVELICARTGRRYTNRRTIGCARDKLTEAGLVTVDVGKQGWHSRASVYNLLPRSQYTSPSCGGKRVSVLTPPAARPSLSARDREVLRAAVARLRWSQGREQDRWRERRQGRAEEQLPAAVTGVLSAEALDALLGEDDRPARDPAAEKAARAILFGEA
jgi:hypothetical protein